MLLNNKSKAELVIRECINKAVYNMIVLDWVCMNIDDRQKIIYSLGYTKEESYEMAKELCTAVIVFCRNEDGTLDLSRGYLHISTLGTIVNPSDIIDFITHKTHCADDKLDCVILEPQEKLMIMSSIIPAKDMREVK